MSFQDDEFEFPKEERASLENLGWDARSCEIDSANAEKLIDQISQAGEMELELKKTAGGYLERIKLQDPKEISSIKKFLKALLLKRKERKAVEAKKMRRKMLDILKEEFPDA